MSSLLMPTHSRPFGAVSPAVEMGAYEHLWRAGNEGRAHPSFKAVAALFREHPGALPSDFVKSEVASLCAQEVLAHFERRGVEEFGIRLNGLAEYPERLHDAEHPVELLYYRGWWDIMDTPQRIAVVGTRKPSEDGMRRTRKLVRSLVKDNVVVVSGLAAGVDAVAHQAAIDEGGQTIAVIGTPISESYPKENADLQSLIAKDYLLISQVPVLRYREQSIDGKRLYFPERNITMSALTQATVIVEAGPTSGTLIQARAALAQKRKLFILDSNFTTPGLEWPHKFAERGAIRVKDYDDILQALDAPPAAD